LVSDLHVDYPQNMQKIPALVQALRGQEADAFVLAGDVSHKLEHVDAVLRQFAALPMPRLFVPGNHDVWIVREGREPVRDSWDKLERLADLCRAHGFVFLEKASARVAGFTLVGSMGWYDYSYARADLGVSAQEYERKQWKDLTYMDHSYARWGMPDAAVVERLLDPLQKRLKAADDPVLFVSHHVPREDLVLRRGHASWDFFNAYMGSRRTEEALRAARVTRFAFGHTHRPLTLLEPGRCVLNNPLGYPRQSLTPLTSPFVIT
jgi:putative phosphoesterase